MNKFKIFLVNVCFILSLNCSGQIIKLPYNQSTGEITQTNVVDTGQTRENAFNSIHAWITKNYDDYRQIIQVDNSESGQIIYKPIERIYLGKLRAFTFNVTINVRDGKYSCVIDRVRVQQVGSRNFFSVRIGSDKMDKKASEIMVLQFDTIQIGMKNAVMAGKTISRFAGFE